MNKPAPKEPSMDEILSSIRQIIADDDAAPSGRRTDLVSSPAVPEASPPEAVEPEPFRLSAEQIMRDAAADEADDGPSGEEMHPPVGGRDSDDGPPQLVDPEDVSFDDEDEPEPEAEPAPMVVAPPPVRPRRPEPAPSPLPIAPATQLPDPRLSADMADDLLGPAAESAVKTTMGKLSNLSLVGAGLTLEELMRQMLRPMLKEWLDENLPAVVERMVEKEIERVSRGGR
jgi:cell pole-organizing protein PopZ